MPPPDGGAAPLPPPRRHDDRRHRRRPRFAGPAAASAVPWSLPFREIRSTAKLSKTTITSRTNAAAYAFSGRPPRPPASCCRRSWSGCCRFPCRVPTHRVEPCSRAVSDAPSRITTIAVSPAIRPIPSVAPVAIPCARPGSRTRRIVEACPCPARMTPRARGRGSPAAPRGSPRRPVAARSGTS